MLALFPPGWSESFSTTKGFLVPGGSLQPGPWALRMKGEDSSHGPFGEGPVWLLNRQDGQAEPQAVTPLPLMLSAALH